MAYMFEHRKTSPVCTQEETRRWLAWMAEQMQQHQLTTFSIERIQPAWLPNGWLRRLYLGLNRGLVLGLAVGILIGLIVALINGFISGWVNGIWTGLIDLWIIEIVIGLLIGPIFGLVALPSLVADHRAAL